MSQHFTHKIHLRCSTRSASSPNRSGFNFYRLWQNKGKKAGFQMRSNVSSSINQQVPVNVNDFRTDYRG